MTERRTGSGDNRAVFSKITAPQLMVDTSHLAMDTATEETTRDFLCPNLGIG